MVGHDCALVHNDAGIYGRNSLNIPFYDFTVWGKGQSRAGQVSGPYDRRKQRFAILGADRNEVASGTAVIILFQSKWLALLHRVIPSVSRMASSRPRIWAFMGPSSMWS